MQHIVECVETGEWPVSKKFSAYAQNSSGICGVGIDDSDNGINKRELGQVHDHLSMSEMHNDHSSLRTNVMMAHSNVNLKRKRHIAIDVETERGLIIKFFIKIMNECYKKNV